MTIRASSGTAPGPMTPAGNGPGGHHQAAPAGAATTRARLRRYGPRDRAALAAALAGPLAASGVLLPFRASWPDTSVALLLVVVVVAVAAAGNRAAGALAAVGAAVWFDFFFTLPYYRLTIRSTDDVTAAVLLLVTGLAVSQLAARARRLKVTAVTGEGYLATMHGTAALAQASRSPEAVAEYVGDLLAGLLDLQEWRFEYGSLRSHPPRLESDGSVIDGQRSWDVRQAGLPAELELLGNGQYHGRFLMRPRPGARPAARARLVAVALAEQGRARLQRCPGARECPLTGWPCRPAILPACGDALACGLSATSRAWRAWRRG